MGGWWFVNVKWEIIGGPYRHRGNAAGAGAIAQFVDKKSWLRFRFPIL